MARLHFRNAPFAIFLLEKSLSTQFKSYGSCCVILQQPAESDPILKPSSRLVAKARTGLSGQAQRRIGMIRPFALMIRISVFGIIVRIQIRKHQIRSTIAGS
jgi:hypothetical protein